MSRFRVRFSKTLYPGSAIKTEIWKLEEGKALFRTINAETGEVVLDRGHVGRQRGGPLESGNGALGLMAVERIGSALVQPRGLERGAAAEERREGQSGEQLRSPLHGAPILPSRNRDCKRPT